MKENRLVLQIGPGLSAKGGISAVLNAYASYYNGFEQLGYELLFISSAATRKLAAVEFSLAWFRLIWLTLRRNVYVVHIHTSIRGSLIRKCVLALTCFLMKQQFFLHIHSGAFTQYYEGLPKIVRAIVRAVFRKANCVVCLSTYARDELIASGLATSECCRLVYNGIPDPLQKIPKRRAPSEATTITFLGRLSEAKGLPVLLKALAALPTKQPFRLVVGGTGNAELFRGWVHSLKLEDKVVYKGWVTGVDKIELLHATEIFVLPSYSEGFPVAIVEAMAYGTSIVSTRIPGVVDAIRDENDGLLVNPGDPEALCRALATLLNSPTVRDRLGRSARQRFLDQFTIQQTARQLASAYDSLRDR